MKNPTERQARILWMAITCLSVAVIISLVAAAIWGLGQVVGVLSPVLWPLAMAVVLAYLLDPVVDWFERKGLKRKKAVLCVFAIALLIIGGVSAIVLPQIISETRELVRRVPTYTRRVQARVQDWINHPPGLMQKFMERDRLPPVEAGETNITAVTNNPGTNATPETMGTNPTSAPGSGLNQETLQKAAIWGTQALQKFGTWLLGQYTKVGSLLGVLVGLVLIPVYLFYLLVEKRGIKSSWTDYLPVKDSRFKTELVFVLKAINDLLITFFRGQVLVAICDGILYTIGFLIIGLPYAVLIGALAIFLTIVPFIGAIMVCGLALFISLVQYGDWQHPALVLAVVVVVQSLEALFISPKIMEERVGLHPLTIIIAVMAGTTLLGGVLGGLLAIPLTAAGKVLMYRYVWKKPET